MADQPSAKKLKKIGGGIVNLFRDVIKRSKSAIDLASQSNSTRDSAPSTFGARDPVPVNDARSGGPTASSM